MSGEVRALLEEIASNLAFAWTPGARELFERLDPDLWERVDHNPRAFVLDVDPARLDPGVAEEAGRVLEAMRSQPSEPTWWQREHGGDDGCLVAYFSMEFGVDESLPIYSGGLGVLAGDHLKSAHDLGVPLVGVGLFYSDGYFRQALDETGRQVERYPVIDPTRLPLMLEDPTVTVDLAGDLVTARIWRADVGRTRLYLLEAPGVTDRLYGGDREHRIRQEVLVGVGGVRALRALGLRPTVFHMNEGHAGFLAVERLRALVADGVPFEDAFERVRASTVFTTHTPVPAGNEVFDPGFVRRYLGDAVAACGIDWEEFEALGRIDEGDSGFGMTPFALRVSARANAVSELHGGVSRRMWARMWPDRQLDAVPIGHVTNGVHAATWTLPELRAELPTEELWQVRCRHKRTLIELARRRFERQLGGRGGETFSLEPDALTIGFARRFATYKRARLLFSDPERLARLLGDAARPLQILLAGKSHPADEGGKDLIQRIVQFTRDPRSGGRVVFLEDYEMTLARCLVQGVDVWLNTPRRPLEASGTSGMKAGMNGALNVSTLDGWWAEAYSPEIGFAVGEADEAVDEAEQDARDAADLYRVLEEQVIPLYYARGDDGVPHDWLRLAGNAVREVGARFNTGRMVAEYVDRYYVPAHRDAAERTERQRV